ncbi:MAG: hypothetical protein ACI90V_005576 [Bacillariaceae sp.]|jgi:hypothetical protein
MKRLTNILISLFAALKPEEITSSTIINGSSIISSTPSICRSNSTHIVWKLSQQQKQQQQKVEYQCIVQTRKNAEKLCMEYLKNNIMSFDEPFKETMGFPLNNDDDNNNDDDADGLGNGLVGPTVALALDSKVQYKYTDNLQPDFFFEYVLNYANLNEARTNWRPFIVNALQFNESDLFHSSILNKTTTNNNINGVYNDDDNDDDDAVAIAAVTKWVNTHLWTKLARHEDEPIYFKSSQTPLIFDPMSIIAFGYASCTGTSVLFTNGLRACGVPARVVGTPAWYGNRTNGNHNWVEVYVPNNNNIEGGGEWKFLEPSPALAHVDTLDDDPCNRWFCDPSRYPSSKVYAAKLSKTTSITPTTTTTTSEGHFPLAWEWDCHDVPAEDRTDYYTKICGSCNGGDKQQE